MTKYKEAGNDHFIKIFLDEQGNELTRTASFKNGRGSGTGLHAEMIAWQENGGVIEPLETAEEITEREAEEAAGAIQSTKNLCIKNLNDSEIHVTNDPPYPDDVQEWIDKRAEWRTILKSGTAQAVPDKPYGAT